MRNNKTIQYLTLRETEVISRLSYKLILSNKNRLLIFFK